jgi:hypothetical protein
MRGFLVVYLAVHDKKLTMVCSLVNSHGYLFFVFLVKSFVDKRPKNTKLRQLMEGS